MYSLDLQCRCGKVKGVAKGIKPSDGTRVKCYCQSCRQFANNLKADDALDSAGGTDIYQLSPSQVEFHQGNEHIKGMRLSDKGIHRWYASCCNTPIGNTVSIKLPFIGLIHPIFADKQKADEVLGPVRALVHTDGATADISATANKLKSHYAYFVTFLLKMLGWKLSGKGKPSPFYDNDGKRLYPLDTWNKG